MGADQQRDQRRERRRKMTNKPIIPTTEEVLSTMEAELYKARCIVLTEDPSESRRPVILRVAAISSFYVLCEYEGQTETRVRKIGGGFVDVAESLPEVLTRIARIEKDR